EAEVGAKREFADAIAVFVGMAILPEFVFEVFAFAFGVHQAPADKFQHQRRGLQIAVLAVEIVARGRVADEAAIYGTRCRKDFACWKVRPIARADQAAGFYPIELAVEMRGKGSAGLGFYRERFRP